MARPYATNGLAAARAALNDSSGPLDGPIHETTRDRILHAIEDRPGSCVRSLQRRLELGYGTVDYHVWKLRRAGKIRVLRDGRRVLLTLAGVDADAARAASALRDPHLAQLWEYVKAGSPRCASDVVRAASHRLGWPASTVRDRLHRLIADGLLTQAGEGLVDALSGNRHRLGPES